ncbi:MAG TPA: zinc-ribbon domain-containing protein [Bryobacteraceae bacterium]
MKTFFSKSSCLLVYALQTERMNVLDQFANIAKTHGAIAAYNARKSQPERMPLMLCWPVEQWHCQDCGHKWTTPPNDRAQGEPECPKCANPEERDEVPASGPRWNDPLAQNWLGERG